MCLPTDTQVDSSSRYSSGKRYSDDDQYGGDRKRRQGCYSHCVVNTPATVLAGIVFIPAIDLDWVD